MTIFYWDRPSLQTTQLQTADRTLITTTVFTGSISGTTLTVTAITDPAAANVGKINWIATL
jgi:hypothetical protein